MELKFKGRMAYQINLQWQFCKISNVNLLTTVYIKCNVVTCLINLNRACVVSENNTHIFRNEVFIGLQFCWDGADMFEKSGKSIWPLAVSILNFPKDLRDKMNIGLHVVAMCPGIIYYLCVFNVSTMVFQCFYDVFSMFLQCFL